MGYGKDGRKRGAAMLGMLFCVGSNGEDEIHVGEANGSDGRDEGTKPGLVFGHTIADAAPSIVV